MVCRLDDVGDQDAIECVGEIIPLVKGGIGSEEYGDGLLTDVLDSIGEDPGEILGRDTEEIGNGFEGLEIGDGGRSILREAVIEAEVTQEEDGREDSKDTLDVLGLEAQGFEGRLEFPEAELIAIGAIGDPIVAGGGEEIVLGGIGEQPELGALFEGGTGEELVEDVEGAIVGGSERDPETVTFEAEDQEFGTGEMV